MADLGVTNTFSNGTAAQAAEVNQNFTDVVDWVNTNAIRKDATVAFTSVPSGPATDPSSTNHLVRKKYVDDRIATSVVANADAQVQGTGTDTVTGAGTTIADPGYNYVVWGVAQLCVNPATNFDIQNMWSMAIRINGVVKGEFRIPVVAGGQSMAVIMPQQSISSGTAAVISLVTAREVGSQASLTINAGASLSFTQVWWRRA